MSKLLLVTISMIRSCLIFFSLILGTQCTWTRLYGDGSINKPTTFGSAPGAREEAMSALVTSADGTSQRLFLFGGIGKIVAAM
jgi:hypothetical protein